jgi:hypothetical protein
MNLFPLASAALFAIAIAGCAHVAPYEREHLADPSMDVSHENVESRFRSHVHDSREGATGGSGSTGGGCGCN